MKLSRVVDNLIGVQSQQTKGSLLDYICLSDLRKREHLLKYL